MHISIDLLENPKHNPRKKEKEKKKTLYFVDKADRTLSRIFRKRH